MERFSIKKQWDVSDFYELDYFLTTHKDLELIDQYAESGHNKEMMSLYNYHEPNPMPDCIEEYIKPQFNFLGKVGAAVNLFKPGQYLPIHVDIFARYTKVHNAEHDEIIRYILMLEDSEPGQIIQIEDYCFGEWKSGDCFGWTGSERHAFYNFSMKNRYAIQITGVMK